MRSMMLLLALAAGVVLASPAVVSADSPYPINGCYFNPNDLKATDPPGPGPGTDGTGDHLVIPPRRLDQSALNDPKAVRWPTLDKSEFEGLKDQYAFQPQTNCSR